MIIGVIKSLLYMFIFYVFLRVSNFLLKFFYTLIYKKNQKKDDDTENNALNMLQCSICKIYITKSEAYSIDGEIFCKEHKDHKNQ